MKNSFTRWLMLFQDARMEIGVRKVVRMDQEDAEAVNAHVIVDRRGSDPGKVEFEAITGRAERDAGNEQERKQKFERGDDHGHTADPTVVVGAKNHQRESA